MNRILIFAPDPAVSEWIEVEVMEERLTLQLARSVREVVRALVQDPPPRPQILVADLDAMSPADVLGLHQIRERGWFGSVIALGDVNNDLCRSLNVEIVLARPLARGALRDAIAQVGLDRSTVLSLGAVLDD